MKDNITMYQCGLCNDIKYGSIFFESVKDVEEHIKHGHPIHHLQKYCIDHAVKKRHIRLPDDVEIVIDEETNERSE